jgi:membrane protein YdbS with pleckstrin-like domain
MQVADAQPRLSVKRHPIVLVRNFLAVQFASAGTYALAGSVLHFARIWRELPLLSNIPFTVAQAILVFGAEVALVMYIFLSWYRSNLYAYDGHVIVSNGLVWRSTKRVPVPLSASLDIRQNPLGRLTKYGTVVVTEGSKVARLTHVPEPGHFARTLRGMSGKISAPHDPAQLLTEPEHDGLEFKSSLRWDIRNGKVNRALERSAIKTIAAFMNSKGGHLVIGVTDDRTVRGLQDDIRTLQRKDKDGFEVHVGNIFNSMIGAHLRGCLAIQWAEHKNNPYCILTVAPAAEPAYVRVDNAEEFFVRTGNGTTSLTVSQVPAYLRSRFGNM